MVSMTAETACLFGSRQLLARLGGATQLTIFPTCDSFRIAVSADAEVQNANGEPFARVKEDRPLKPIPETAGDQAVQLLGSVSIVLEKAANEDAKLELLGTGQALSPAWSDSQASTSVLPELMYSMPPHAPSQNAALAYDSHSYSEGQGPPLL